MGKDFYEWIFKNSPERWDCAGGVQGVDSFIKGSLEQFTGIPLKIIDLGCGNGRTLSVIARPEWDLMGIDYVPEAVNLAQKKLGDKARVIVGDMNSTGLEAHSFDVVYSCGSFEHMDVPNFNEPYRLLKEGGLFLCTVAIGDKGKVETQFCKVTGTENWGTQWEWELPVKMWISKLEDAGFEVIYSNDNGEFVCQGQEKK